MRPPDAARPAGTRRAALAAFCLICLPALALAAAQTEDPSGHPPPAPDGSADTPGIQSVTRRVLCTCGTCVNQTLHECTCGTAAAERAKIAAALARGESPDAIVEAYVTQYGQQILASPEDSTFNLVGWLMPFIVAVAGLAILTFVLRGWVRAAPARADDAPAGPGTPPQPGDDKDYRERLERQLREFKI